MKSSILSLEALRRRASTTRLKGGCSRSREGTEAVQEKLSANSARRSEHVAKDIEAGRLKFWGKPCFDPVPFLDNRSKEVYEHPFSHARIYDPEAETVPRVRVRCRREELYKFLHLLDSTDRLGLYPTSSIRKGLECGAFSVPKDGSRDRLILDARAPNQMEVAEDRWIRSLGSVQQFGHFFLEKAEELRMHTEDLREFYHSFLVGAERSKRNAFKVQLTRAEAKRFRCFDSGRAGEEDYEGTYTPVLRTMAMGDCNAVSFGQISHLGALVSAGIISVADLVTLEQGPPRQRWFGGLMIDDLLLAEAVPRGCPDDLETFGKKKMEEIRGRYEEVGLPRHEGKSESFTKECTVWGVQINGEAGTVRPSLKRIIPLCCLVCNVLAVNHCTVGLLEILAGSFCSVFQVQRRHMAVLEEVYEAQRGRSSTEVVKLSRELRDELLAAVGLTAVTSMNLRLEPSSKVVASDASSTAEAAVVADIDPKAVLELQRLGLSKGLWNRLLNPYAAYFREKGDLEVESELLGETYDMHPVWRDLATCLNFKQYGKTVTRSRRRHINLGEIRSALAAEKLFSLEHPGEFYLHLQDSQVSLACMVKGRSSSRSINVELKRSIPYSTGQQVKGFYGYVRTKLNPSDDPTRKVRIREPSRTKPLWLSQLEEGKFEEYDDYLHRNGVSREQTNRLPAEDELYSQSRVDLRSAKQRRDQGTREQQRARKNRGEGKDSKSEAEEPIAVEVSEERPKSEGGKEDAEPTQLRDNCVQVGEDEELRRRGDFREGGRAELRQALPWIEDSEVAEILLSFPPEQFEFSKSFGSHAEALKSGPGFLDLFSGVRGVARACVEGAPCWVLCFDLGHHHSEDLLRAPFPEPLLEAVLVLAVRWGWKTWAGCTALCFFGACRIGEVLSASRRELLTPEDLLSSEKKVYFRIKSPKARKRGASVQYTTVDVPFWAEFVSQIFARHKPQEPLYSGNASAYRSRLEAILRHIGVGKEHRLTPGSLRGGGAVAAHKRGVGINDLLWKLRLQHLRTLSYYLQETTAISILPALPNTVRCRIQLLRGLLPKLRFEVLSATAQ